MKAALTTLAVAATLLAGAPAWAGGDSTAGKEKAATCIACHGEDGLSNTAQVPQPPRIAGQHADYLVKALEDYASGARSNVIMAAFAATLTETDREDLAAFYSSLPSSLTELRKDD